LSRRFSFNWPLDDFFFPFWRHYPHFTRPDSPFPFSSGMSDVTEPLPRCPSPPSLSLLPLSLSYPTSVGGDILRVFSVRRKVFFSEFLLRPTECWFRRPLKWTRRILHFCMSPLPTSTSHDCPITRISATCQALSSLPFPTLPFLFHQWHSLKGHSKTSVVDFFKSFKSKPSCDGPFLSPPHIFLNLIPFSWSSPRGYGFNSCTPPILSPPLHLRWLFSS